VNGPLPQGAEKAEAVRGLFDKISPRYDLVNRIMTFGLDVGWRRKAVGHLRLPGGCTVIDLACGTGDLCRELDRAGYRAIGFDFSPGMLSAAGTLAPLVLSDVLRLPLGDASVEGVTCGFALRNVTSLEELFNEIARVLRRSGRVSLLETAEPASRLMRAGHSIYFSRIVPLIGRILSDGEAYAYLPRSMAYLPEPETMTAMLSAAGFEDLRRLDLSGGVAQLITGTRVR
jgi:demethylmenaquinone methyltransferase/2-methoxy-6-polyprenyl-1,4-benzoquinol methylase